MAFASIFSGGLGAIYFHLVKDRVDGDVEDHWTKNLAFMRPVKPISIEDVRWLIIEIEVSLCGIPQSFIFGALPSLGFKKVGKNLGCGSRASASLGR